MLTRIAELSLSDDARAFLERNEISAYDPDTGASMKPWGIYSEVGRWLLWGQTWAHPVYAESEQEAIEDARTYIQRRRRRK